MPQSPDSGAGHGPADRPGSGATPPPGEFVTPTARQAVWWVVLVGALAWLFYALSPILAPFALAAILAYVLSPGVDWLARRGLPRPLASVLMILLLVFVVALLTLLAIAVLQREVPALREQVPVLLSRLDAFVSPRLSEFGIHVQIDFDGLRRMLTEQIAASSDEVLAQALRTLRISGSAAIAVVGMIVFVPLVLYYLLNDWHRLLALVAGAIPPRWRGKVLELADETDGLLSQYLRGQLLVMVILALYYSAGLGLAGFEVALPVGLFTGLAVFVPYAGYGIGLMLALLAALLQYGDWTGFIFVAVIYGFGQVLESFFLTPRLVGERIGLHPVAVIFALLAFGQLFGFFGVLLALPASAVVLVLLRQLKRSYLDSGFYGG